MSYISFFTVWLLFKCCFVAWKRGLPQTFALVCFVMINGIHFTLSCVWILHFLHVSAPYVKVYLLEGKHCVEKQKTTTARRTLDPLYQQQLVFSESYRGRILQVSRWTMPCTSFIYHVCLGAVSVGRLEKRFIYERSFEMWVCLWQSLTTLRWPVQLTGR